MAVRSDQPVPPDRLARNLAAVRERISAAAARAGRSASEVTLLAVTKYVGLPEIRELLKLGVKDLGESRIQDARAKLESLAEEVQAAGARWHFIGHLQTNKAKYAVRGYDCLEAVDSVALLEALAHECLKRGRERLECLAEVNISGEAQKHGLAPAELEAFLAAAARFPVCALRGLMCMAPYGDDPESLSRPVFRRLRELRDEAQSKCWYPQPLGELSMGMTQDFEIAIEEGATRVRVGSALFE